MAASQYGAYQPGAVDPWPIESMLAEKSITSPASARGLLSSYLQQRQAQTNVYGEEAEKQHEVAKQQILAQMTEARNKLIPELVGKPGGGAFIAGGGIEGLGPAAGGTGNAGAWTGLGHAGEQHDFANNYEKVGKGTESLSRSGQDVALQQIPGYTNLQSTGAGKHSDITVQELKNNNAVQLAGMRAARGAKAEKDPRAHYTFYGPPTEGGQPNNATVSLGINTPPAVYQSHRDTISRNLGIVNPTGNGIPGATGERTSGTSTTPAARENVPGLARAPAQGSGAQGSGAGGGQVRFNTDPKVQAAAKRAYEYLSPEAKVQVWANKPGNVMPVVTPDKGNAYFVGRDGQRHEVPAAGAR